jgi:peptide/nickel transport system substrate-binding protein
VGTPIAVDGGAEAVAVGDGAVWVASQSANSVARIDPQTKSVIQTIPVGGGPSALAVGPGAVWVVNSLDGTVSGIDTGTNKVTSTVAVGAGPSGVAVTADGKTVWVSNEYGGTLSRIEPALNKVVKTVPTGNRPTGVTTGPTAVFASVQSSSRTHRGGTVTVAEPGKIPAEAGLVDPSQGYGAWELWTVANDGLVAVNPFGGSLDARLVADLATSIPTPTDGGRTYTFQLRQGIRYNTGALVRPADVRRGIERALLNSGAATGYPADYFTGIVGAGQCEKPGLKRCDLSQGIVTDDQANTVTFHLTAPDPDFLYKLALPPMDAVPASTPLTAQLPLPATGPYQVASYDAKHGLIRMVRNPRFHEWAPGAQPDGYPDAIVEKFGYTPQSAVHAVEQGTADLVGGLLPEQWSPLRTNYAPQLHNSPTLVTRWYVLNTTKAPFNKLAVRQAVSYAVNRNRVAALRGGPEVEQPSCQALPPDVPGYKRYCPFTIHPTANGNYTGPDPAKARQLVAASGTKGQPVTVLLLQEAAPAELGPDRYLVSVLRALGYKAQLKIVKAFPAFVAAVNSGRFQALFSGLQTDYPATSSVFVPTFTCASLRHGRSVNGNETGFCNSRIDAEIARAQLLQTGDPQAASRLWTKIDRDIVDQAPIVATGNQRTLDFTSRRLRNYQFSPRTNTATLDQLWVR